MSLQGDLEFRDANKITFIGGSSNTLIDLTTGSLGVGVTGTSLSSNLHVAGNKIKVGDNIFSTDGPHARLPKEVPLKKYPEIAFDASKLDGNDTTRTYVQAGYTVSASADDVVEDRVAWKVFNGVYPASLATDFWYSNDLGNYNGGATSREYDGSTNLGTDSGRTATQPGEWLQINLPNKIQLTKFNVWGQPDTPDNYPAGGVLYARNNTSEDWTQLHVFDEVSIITNTPYIHKLSTTPSYYDTYALVITKISQTGTSGVSVGELELYGYEEDPPAGDTSIDTTFTSIMNTPQTTGANVYVDGNLGETFTNRVVGPTVSNTHTTYVSAEKYWELSGNVESNVTLEANTFLSGDAPHSLSMWFNSSNLEANVSNTCVFSVSDQEKLDSVNLDLQSNTWHNLTYAYQGEGGSRVAYLDGRKVLEDQAEDTFGDYPPFAMTGYSQGGYVVSANNFYTAANNERDPWRAYDGIDNNNATHNWGTTIDTAESFEKTGDCLAKNNTGGNPDTFVDETGTSHRGHWNKIKLPYKLRVESISINCALNYNRRAGKVAILGSNDNQKWYLLKDVTTNLDFTTVTPQIVHMENNKNKGFKYLILVVKTAPGADGAVTIREISYQGHRENDLVRLPDPTNVLKYPHIVMTGYAQRGYVVSSNNEYTGDGRLAWKAYDGIDTDGSTNVDAWMTLDPSWTTATPGEPTGTGDNAPDTFTVGGVDYTGHWNKLELPHKIRVSQIYMSSRMTDRLPYKGVFLGSDDDSSWEVIYSFNNTLTWSVVSGVGEATTITGITNTNSYKYVMLVVQQINGSDDRLWLNQIKYYGTGVDSIPIQIGGGNIDKVANFRVYDKFIGEDQALEIWDAQKDEFGRAKSSMTLYKGRLGLGTTEPEGRLAVLDEPDPTTYGLQEFPPKPLDAYKTHLEGHGEFCVSASSQLYPDTGGSSGYYYAYNVFDEAGTSTISNMSWISMNNGNSHPLLYTLGTGLPTANAARTGGISGEWVQLKLPYKIKLSYLRLMGQAAYTNRAPVDGVLVGSTDGVTWTTVSSWSGASYTDLQYNTFTANVDSTNYYNYLRLIVTRVSGVANHLMAAIQELKFFGIREQVTKQSVLHDGQLTLTKNLNVPRIGPALGADDTPRRDRLVVEYNTSTNPTFEGAVRDTSGRGLDGVFVGTATYNTNEKVFDGFSNTKYIRTDLTVLRGNVPHSHSVWIKLTSDNNNWNTAINLGQNNGNGNQSAVTWDTGNNRLWLNTYNGGVYAQIAPDMNKWYHVVATHDGSGAPSITTMKIYINGNQWPIYDTTGNGGGGTINIAGDYLTIGAGRTSSGAVQNIFNGDISTYKLYNTALTASEAGTLYNMGRCDEGHHVVNFSKTRVGIGLGHGEAPRSALDVRDLIYAESSSVQTFTGQHICFPDESMEKGLIVSAKKNKFVKLNGLATGKSAITIDESLPIVSLSNVSQDKACFGVVSKMEESNAAYRTEITGGLVSESVKIVGDNRAIVNSVGEGAIWVVDTNGPLESGDYITTSNVAGYGQKQDSEFLANYSVAKITMDCDFTASNVAVQTIKREQTGTRIITEDAWNQLVEYDRYSNVEDEITTYYQIQRGENVLDDNGQLQFEDKTGATEAPYERRFLTTDGTQTDEANAVHIAAFVGCTYHCG